MRLFFELLGDSAPCVDKSTTVEKASKVTILESLLLVVEAKVGETVPRVVNGGVREFSMRYRI